MVWQGERIISEEKAPEFSIALNAMHFSSKEEPSVQGDALLDLMEKLPLTISEAEWKDASISVEVVEGITTVRAVVAGEEEYLDMTAALNAGGLAFTLQRLPLNAVPGKTLENHTLDCTVDQYGRLAAIAHYKGGGEAMTIAAHGTILNIARRLSFSKGHADVETALRKLSDLSKPFDIKEALSGS